MPTRLDWEGNYREMEIEEAITRFGIVQDKDINLGKDFGNHVQAYSNLSEKIRQKKAESKNICRMLRLVKSG